MALRAAERNVTGLAWLKTAVVGKGVHNTVAVATHGFRAGPYLDKKMFGNQPGAAAAHVALRGQGAGGV